MAPHAITASLLTYTTFPLWKNHLRSRFDHKSPRTQLSIFRQHVTFMFSTHVGKKGFHSASFLTEHTSSSFSFFFTSNFSPVFSPLGCFLLNPDSLCLQFHVSLTDDVGKPLKAEISSLNCCRSVFKSFIPKHFQLVNANLANYCPLKRGGATARV